MNYVVKQSDNYIYDSLLNYRTTNFAHAVYVCISYGL